MPENISVIFTGGTIASGKIQRQAPALSSSKGITANQELLYPIYDIRHLALAAAIEKSNKEDPIKENLLQRLVATKELLVKKQHTETQRELGEIARELGFHDTHAAIASSGFAINNTAMPCSIDSINFNLETHYNKIRDAAIRALGGKENQSLIVIGGTDTREFYAGLLSRDLARRGLLNNNKLLFLSSMHSFDANPHHNAQIMQAASIFAQQSGINGAYALTADGRNANIFRAHNVLAGDLHKISAHLEDAMRSKEVTGTIDLTSNSYTMKQNTPSPLTVNRSRQYNTILAPLLANNSIEAINSFLRSVIQKSSAIDGVIIEGIPNPTSPMQKPLLLQQLAELKEKNVKVYFANPDIYNPAVATDEPEKIRPSIASADWESHPLRKELVAKGASFIQGKSATGLYLDCLLDETIKPKQNVDISSAVSGTKKPNVIGLRYMPTNNFNKSLKLIANLTPNIAIAALSCNSVRSDDAMLTDLRRASQNANLYVGFDYNGTRHYDGTTESYTESPYAAAQGAEQYFTAIESADKNPVTEIERLNNTPAMATILRGLT